MFYPKRIKGVGATLLSVAVISGIAATTLGQRQYERFTTQEVWAAAHELSVGQTVQAQDIQIVRVDNAVAKLAITEPLSIIGGVLATAKSVGDVINQGEIGAPKRLGMTDIVPEGRVVYTLALDEQLLPYSRQLRSGDSFDILATTAGGRVTPLATNVILLRSLVDKEPSTTQSGDGSTLWSAVAVANPESADKTNLLVLAVLPEQVYRLASALGSDARISLVAYGRDPEDHKTVPTPQVADRRVEVITGLEKQFVTVRKTAPSL